MAGYTPRSSPSLSEGELPDRRDERRDERRDDRRDERHDERPQAFQGTPEEIRLHELVHRRYVDAMRLHLEDNISDDEELRDIQLDNFSSVAWRLRSERERSSSR